MKLIIRWRPLALGGLVLLGLLLRLYGLNWDQGNSFHPDERQILFHVVTLAWPTSWAQFLDPVRSPLNPHFFAYGSFPLYLLALLGHVVGYNQTTEDFFVKMTLLGRVVSAVFDSGTIFLTGYLALLLTRDEEAGRPTAWNVALLASALVAFTPLELQLSHFYAVDTMLLFFVMLTVTASVALVQTNRPILWSFVIGLGYGLAVATKFSAAPLAIPVCIAVILRWHYRKEIISPVLSLLVAAIVTLVFCLAAQPYMLLDLPNFVQQVSDQSKLVQGGLDLPYVRQFAGTIPVVYEAQNMFLWGMGVTLAGTAFAGLLWFIWRAWKRNLGSWPIVLSWVLVYGVISCTFFVKYMRYMLPLYPLLALIAASALLAFVRRDWSATVPLLRRFERLLPGVRIALIVLVLGGTIFQGLALLNIYSQPNTRIQASEWMYTHLPKGSVLTYEQWDDPLPVPVNGYSIPYTQLTYLNGGQQATGLDLYGDDTTQKAELLARLLPTVNALTMPTDRLDKSIPRLPARYPLTIHYYQLLFSGQLGFHLAAQFENHPNLLGITLDDSNADESYSVFDHPTSRIFVRDTPYPYTADQLLQKLLAGVKLPALGAHLSGTQRSLLLSAQQIEDNQSSPPFSVQFPANGFSNLLPVFFWWLTLTLIGLFVYPLVFHAFRPLADRGYLFSKVLGIALLAYLTWLLASLHLLTFSRNSVLIVACFLFCCGAAAFFVQRHAMVTYIRAHRYCFLLCEGLFVALFLLFVGIRMLDPDLWQVPLGGEKPMELAFLNGLLRSTYMPPLDPWFSGGYINYYYYGYVIFATLIKLIGIVPTTAFNLTIPTLFASTFCGAAVIVYSLTHSRRFGLLAGYFVAVIGNFNGLAQARGQLQALLAHMPVPAFDYWQSSRVIPFTINEFPFWSFLFADLHPHVINMPLSVCMLGVLAAFLLSFQESRTASAAEMRRSRISLLLWAIFIFGTLACVNPWDIPVYAILLTVVLLLQAFLQTRQQRWSEVLIALAWRCVLLVGLFGMSYLLFLPFYISYQELYVNGAGLIKQGSDMGSYLVVFGLWLFLALSFFGWELYRLIMQRRKLREVRPEVGERLPSESTLVPESVEVTLASESSVRWSEFNKLRLSGIVLLGLVVIVLLFLLGLKALLGALLLLGLIASGWLLWQQRVRGRIAGAGQPESFFTQELSPVRLYAYLLLLMGVGICLGIELIYIRDFLDGGDNERLNTFFKFSMQAWICLGIGGALVVYQMRRTLKDLWRQGWTLVLLVLVLSCSVFLVEGVPSRIADHQSWTAIQKPLASVDYTPTLDGFAFVRAWYPGDAAAISWLNAHISGSPVILEAVAPTDYTWFNRVSVFTGLPDVVGWPGHVGEQHYNNQVTNRATDVNLMYSTQDVAQTLELLHYYHVRYIYIGAAERQIYGTNGAGGLAKFDAMAGDELSIVYRAGGVTIYELNDVGSPG